MQLLTPAIDTCFWQWSPHISQLYHHIQHGSNIVHAWMNLDVADTHISSSRAILRYILFVLWRRRPVMIYWKYNTLLHTIKPWQRYVFKLIMDNSYPALIGELLCVCCWYSWVPLNTVQFIMILHTPLQWQQQNENQTSNSQQTPHTSPSQMI